MKKITVLLLAVLLSSLAYAATPVRTADYKPFSITSTQLGQEISSDQLERMMCKAPSMADTAVLLNDYDFVDQRPGRNGLLYTIFRGKQGGKAVRVAFVYYGSPRDYIFVSIAVDEKPVLNCDF